MVARQQLIVAVPMATLQRRLLERVPGDHAQKGMSIHAGAVLPQAGQAAGCRLRNRVPIEHVQDGQLSAQGGVRWQLELGEYLTAATEDSWQGDWQPTGTQPVPDA